MSLQQRLSVSREALVPGKALLFGEYGLLHGGKGLVLTLPQHRFHLRLSRTSGAFQFKVASAFLEESLGGPLLLQTDDFRVLKQFKGAGHLLEQGVAYGPLYNLEQNKRFFLAALAPFVCGEADFFAYGWSLEVLDSYSPSLGLGSSSALIAGLHYLMNFFLYGKECREPNAALRQLPKLMQSLRSLQARASGYDALAQYASVNSASPRLIELTSVPTELAHMHTYADVWQRWREECTLHKLAFGICSTSVYSNTQVVLEQSALAAPQGQKDALAHSQLADQWKAAEFSLLALGPLLDCSFKLASSQGLLGKSSAFGDAAAAMQRKGLHCKTMGAGMGDALFVSGDAKVVRPVADVFKSAAEPKLDMNNSIDAFLVPPRLQRLCEDILTARLAGKWIIQNGDLGYATAPSNIAILKYWGKVPNMLQMADNSSVSFTLGGFRTFTRVEAKHSLFPWDQVNTARAAMPEHEIVWCSSAGEMEAGGHGEGKCLDNKQQAFLRLMCASFAPDLSLRIATFNNFPTACGIASSASGFAALVAAISDLCGLQSLFSSSDLQFWLCEWARIGSGSATRSCVLPNETSKHGSAPSGAATGAAAGGKTGLFVGWECKREAQSTGYVPTEGANNPEGLREGQVEGKLWNSATLVLPHGTLFDNLSSCVAVFSEEEKKISSSAGHNEASSSPLYAIRRANTNMQFERLKRFLREDCFGGVAEIAENDAFAMHSVMQTAQRPACYLNHQVGIFVSRFIQWRNENAVQAFWTLDAGPNVHILFLEHEREKLRAFLQGVSHNSDENALRPSAILENRSNEALNLGASSFLSLLLQSNSLLYRWSP